MTYPGRTFTRVAIVAIVLLLAACGSSTPGLRPQIWTEVPGLGHVVAAAPPDAGRAWLLGGGVLGPGGINQVAMWSAASPAGPWRRDPVAPVPGRDGPNETILGFAGNGSARPEVAFGSRPSPTEGYPRPSTWTASPGAVPPYWREALAPRELFGGPNVVAVGRPAGGPHGYFIAGTWIGPANQVVAAVWASPDGTTWTRDDAEAAFADGPGTESYGFDVADGPSGVLMVGTTATPVPGDPERRSGGLWYAGAGASWVRLPGLTGSGQTVVNAVQTLGTGWLGGGQQGAHPTVWTIDASRRVAGAALPASGGTASGGTASAAVDDIAVTPTSVLAVGVTAAGAPAIWTAARRGNRLGSWRPVGAPPAGAGWAQARVAAANGQVLVVLDNPERSEVWRET